jgi:hypothetical protein
VDEKDIMCEDTYDLQLYLLILHGYDSGAEIDPYGEIVNSAEASVHELKEQTGLAHARVADHNDGHLPHGLLVIVVRHRLLSWYALNRKQRETVLASNTTLHAQQIL